jgi:hypothetical protein
MLQVIWMKKQILLIFALLSFSLMAGSASAAQWVKDPGSCPQTYSGQNCVPNYVCGLIGSVVQCNTSSIWIPDTYYSTNQTQVSVSLATGYVLDCLASTTCQGAWYCQVNSTCEQSDNNWITNCTSVTASKCAQQCKSGYTTCGSISGGQWNGWPICNVSSSPSCTSPMVYDPCTGACNDMYVRLNSTAAPPMQNGNASISGNLFANKSINVGTSAANLLAGFYVQDASVIFNGTTGTTPTSGAGTRFMWIPSKGAIRAGQVLGTGWDDTNIGSTSFASGYNTSASGLSSTAMGTQTIASGAASTAMGSETIATGQYATALGGVTNASGLASTAMGAYTMASGDHSTAMGYAANATKESSTAIGYHTLASGDYSTAMGDYTSAGGIASTAMGEGANASEEGSTAMGLNPIASGIGSTAMGYGTIASGVGSTAMGFGTIASGTYSTAMGWNANASGLTSVAIGTNIIVSGIRTVGINLDTVPNIASANNTMVILGGKVGIGTTSPAEQLTVNGSNILHTASDPALEGSIASSVYLDGAADVFVSGKYAYVTSWNKDTLAIFDVSTPSNPSYIRNITFGAHLNGVTRVYVSGRYAYVLGYDARALYVVDVSNPASPTLTGTFTNATSLNGARGIYVSGRYAYVASESSGTLTVIDISNPAAPSQVASLYDPIYLSSAREVYVSGRYAYVASPASLLPSLAIIDISSPTSPTRVSNYTNSSFSFMDVYVSGAYAYVLGASTSSLLIVNVSNPAAPKFLGSYTALSNPRKVRVLGRYAYVASYSGSLYVVDVSNPAAPTLAGSYTSATYLDGANGLYVSGKYAYVAAFNADRMTVLDISGADLPTASIGGLAASTLDVSGNALVQNNLYVQNGLNVGQGGLNVQSGPSVLNGPSFLINSSTAFFNGTRLSINGQATGTPFLPSAMSSGLFIQDSLAPTGVYVSIPSSSGTDGISATIRATHSGYNGRGRLLLEGSHTGFDGSNIGDGPAGIILSAGNTQANPVSFGLFALYQDTILKLDMLNSGSGGTLDNMMVWAYNRNVGINMPGAFNYPNYRLTVNGTLSTTATTAIGTNSVLRCTTAGTLPVGALTITAGNCGASTATGLYVS